MISLLQGVGFNTSPEYNGIVLGVDRRLHAANYKFGANDTITSIRNFGATPSR